MLLLIDNYDSFSHNLARYFVELGQAVKFVRNDKINVAEVEDLAPKYIVISPGPCTPNEAGVSSDVVERFSAKVPILGVCLGHQVIGQAFSAKVIHAQEIRHGKTSEVYHTQTALFEDIPSPFTATRYHSLVLEAESIPNDFEITAWSLTKDNKREVMAMSHKHFPLHGVQFHPESLLTQGGHQLLNNFLTLTK